MLTEKEIERIIGASFGAAYPEKEAAAAIAKRLSEKVVWEVEYQVSFDGLCRLWELDKAGERHYAGEINTDQLAELDGQLVEVTVKIVEGTKDESETTV